MRTFPKKSQRGQAMTEFVAAMAVFIPLIMGVIYVFKYGDIKHQAIQASRYAAMERALDPHLNESDTVIQHETVARFFRDGDNTKHPIAANEQALAATAGDENPNWGQLNGDPMIKQYADVKVTLAAKSIDSTLLQPIDLATKTFFNGNGMNGGFGTEAGVEVPLANVVHFAPLSNINIAIGAHTVIAGDPWNAGGAADVAGHFTFVSVPGKALSLFSKFPGIDVLFRFLADTPAPQFGCIKPDVVPTATAPNAKYDPQDDPTNPSNPNDQCY